MSHTPCISDRIIEILREEDRLVAQINQLTQRLNSLRSEKRTLQSRMFIDTYQIRRKDVEFRDGDNVPYFGHVADFAKWLRLNSRKKWAEWNRTIYRTSDLIVGKMPDMPATIDELPD